MTTSKFTITIEENGISGCGAYDMQSKDLAIKSFESKKQAQKEIRQMIKNEGYQKHNGFIFNTDLNRSIHTNF